MRKYLLVAILGLAAACGGSDGGGTPDPTPDAAMTGEQPAFTIESKEVTLQPGQEITYCYYFHTPNTSPLVIKRWASNMTPGSHHMIFFFGNNSQPADGTLDPSGNCGGGGLMAPIWIYAAQTPTADMPLPTDDGTGKPLGMNVPANQPGYFQMHYLNSTDGPLTIKVKLDAYAYDAGTSYTQTAAYITYNNSINIPPHAMGDVEQQTCNVPSGAKFWLVSTHAHKQAVLTEVLDGSSTVFSATDWEHPGAKAWKTAPFYTFSSGKMTYRCTYNNDGTNANNTITSGQSAQTNEMCMGTGYYFPATKPLFCLDSSGPF